MLCSLLADLEEDNTTTGHMSQNFTNPSKCLHGYWLRCLTKQSGLFWPDFELIKQQNRTYCFTTWVDSKQEFLTSKSINPPSLLGFMNFWKNNMIKMLQLLTIGFFSFPQMKKCVGKSSTSGTLRNFMIGFIQNRYIAKSIFHNYLSSYCQQKQIWIVHLILRTICNGQDSLSKLFLQLWLTESL